MSGTIPLSMTQQMDQYGDPLSGGKLYFFVAGTVSTFQNAYQDSGLTLVHPNPITLDATGRVPQLFLADGLIKIRLTDAVGVVQLVADNIQVIGASSGGGGGGAIDVTTIFRTGDIKKRYDTGTHTGWVRLNGLSIGSATSGATELNHISAQALFIHLWNVQPLLTVIGGRGANALADWDANRQLVLPDARGRALAGLDDMGNVAAGILTSAYFYPGFPTTLIGAIGGLQSYTLTQAQTPIVNHSHPITALAGTGSGSGGATTSGMSAQHTHHYGWSGTTSGQSANHTHAESVGSNGSNGTIAAGGGTYYGGNVGGTTGVASNDHSHTYSGESDTANASADHSHTVTVPVTVTVSSTGVTGNTQYSGNTPYLNVQPTMLVTIYIKL